MVREELVRLRARAEAATLTRDLEALFTARRNREVPGGEPDSAGRRAGY
jgi:hypothetical protein